MLYTIHVHNYKRHQPSTNGKKRTWVAISTNFLRDPKIRALKDTERTIYLAAILNANDDGIWIVQKSHIVFEANLSNRVKLEERLQAIADQGLIEWTVSNALETHAEKVKKQVPNALETENPNALEAVDNLGSNALESDSYCVPNALETVSNPILTGVYCDPNALEKELEPPTEQVSGPSTNMTDMIYKQPPFPPTEDAGAVEGEKLLSELEEYFTQQLQVPHLGTSDFRHIRSFIERQIPLALIRQVVADAKRGYRPKYPGDRIKHVGFFVREIETRMAAPSSPAPTGVAPAPSLTAEEIACDERLSRKLEDLRKELRTALTHRRPGEDPRFIAALRGIQQKAIGQDIPWTLIVAGTDLEGSVA